MMLLGISVVTENVVGRRRRLRYDKRHGTKTIVEAWCDYTPESGAKVEKKQWAIMPVVCSARDGRQTDQCRSPRGAQDELFIMNKIRERINTFQFLAGPTIINPTTTTIEKDSSNYSTVTLFCTNCHDDVLSS